MAVTEEFVEQVSEALDQLGYSVEQEEDVISDVSQIDDDVTLPGIRVQSGTMTGYVSMKLAVLKQYLDNTVQTIQQTWNAWFSDVLPTGVRSIWTTWFGARQTEWDTMSTEVGNATDMAVQAADNADSAAQNAEWPRTRPPLPQSRPSMPRPRATMPKLRAIMLRSGTTIHPLSATERQAI